MGFDTFPMITASNSGWLQRVYASIITCPIACDTTYQPPTTHIGLRHFPPALIENQHRTCKVSFLLKRAFFIDLNVLLTWMGV